MIRYDPAFSDVNGSRRVRVLEPHDWNVDQITIPAATFHDSRFVSIIGFAHHQIIFQTDVAVVNIELFVRPGLIQGVGGDSLPIGRYFPIPTVISTTAGVQYATEYFGLERPLAAAGEEFRFAPTIQVDFNNLSGVQCVLSAWLVSMD